ncbi:MAG: hypothetical protein ACOC3I_03465, partial [Verrucomicrobiota bacterium]
IRPAWPIPSMVPAIVPPPGEEALAPLHHTQVPGRQAGGKRGAHGGLPGQARAHYGQGMNQVSSGHYSTVESSTGLSTESIELKR